LVLGGSLGAQGINDIVPKAIASLSAEDRPDILHQTGEKHFDQTQKAYESVGLTVNLQPFIQDMAHAYDWADVVLCRAGALTVAELCAVGLGAIFIPYPHAVDDHQTANANYMVEHKAAICIPQKELTESRLADIVRRFSAEPDERLLMAQAAYELRKVNAAERIYEICQEICH
jgi:UDP-N-acetylglucosamine--N-acetylmuramyl-(pentapeptide) pyrophosphoryl-undecaprenol N-acetylglucosamine transferase